MGSSRPRVVAILPNLIPSTTLTVVKPLLGLRRADQIALDLTLESWVSRRSLEAADVVVFSRNLQTAYRRVLDVVLRLGKPFIYDIDDNFFELPSLYQREVFQSHQENLSLLEDYLRHAALVRVYATPMLERVQRLNPRVVRVDGLVDWSLVPPTPPRRDLRRVRIVYATSRVRQDDLALLFLPALQRVLTEYKDKVELYCWGYHPPELQNVSAVHFLNYVHNYDKFFRRFARAGFDIGLAPLRNETFYRSKTNNKFREYAACRIAGVYSDVDVYTSCVEHKRSGLLVPNTPEAWYHAIVHLIEDAALRTTIQEHAFSYVRTHYSLEKAQQEWLSHLYYVLQHHPQSGQTRPTSAAQSTIVVDGDTRMSLPSPLHYAARWWHQFIQSLRSRSPSIVVRTLIHILHNVWNQFYLKWMLLRARVRLSEKGKGTVP